MIGMISYQAVFSTQPMSVHFLSISSQPGAPFRQALVVDRRIWFQWYPSYSKPPEPKYNKTMDSIQILTKMGRKTFSSSSREKITAQNSQQTYKGIWYRPSGGWPNVTSAIAAACSGGDKQSRCQLQGGENVHGEPNYRRCYYNYDSDMTFLLIRPPSLAANSYW